MTSGMHTIVRTRDGWVGGADPRREGGCGAMSAKASGSRSE